MTMIRVLLLAVLLSGVVLFLRSFDGHRMAAVAANDPVPQPAVLAGGKDWPIFRGDPLQTGVAPEKLPDKLEVL